MKHIITLLLFCIFSVPLLAQKSTVTREVKAWKWNDTYSRNDSVAVDTLHLNFQDINAIDKLSIANSFNGNLGSPIQTKLYFSRPEESDFMFTTPYLPYISNVENGVFYNTRTPFSDLKYLSGGQLHRKEEQVAFLFTANANKRLNFGLTLDYIYATGEYAKQGARHFNGSLFGSYRGERYSATGMLSTNNLNNKESGGITDESYLLNPPYGSIPGNFPTRITSDAQSIYKHLHFYYDHNYSVGFNRELKDTIDGVVQTEFVPVTRFGHRLRIDDMQKQYHENIPDTGFYANTYLPIISRADTARLLNISNRVSINMAEEFNTFMRFGLTAFLENEVQRFTYADYDYPNIYSQPELDSLKNLGWTNSEWKSNTKVGGILSKELGQAFTYRILGEINLLGYKIGDFGVHADIASSFRLWKDTIQLRAKGFIRSDEPSFYKQQYRSNHFIWNNDFSKIYRTRAGGNFSIPTRYFSAELAVENTSNTVYFDTEGVPTQYSGNVQILSLNVKQDFHLGVFTLENNVVYQLSSNQEIIPLPTLALYHNLYYHSKWFDILNMQIGVDVRYHTAYYAPELMPAIGQFFNQREMMVGNYPVMNAYINVHLKKARFYLKYYHINEFFMNDVYYSMPHYPLAPAILKMGLTWCFYD